MTTMVNSARNFSHQKRIFLLNKLDEVIRIWASDTGSGSFSFSVKDGVPCLQFGVQLEMQDVFGPEPGHNLHHPQQPQTEAVSPYE